MSIEEFVVEQQFILLSWFSLVEEGEEDGECWDVFIIAEFVLEEGKLYDICECKEVADKRLLEDEGDIKQLVASMFDSPFPFIFTSSKLEDVEVSSHE